VRCITEPVKPGPKPQGIKYDRRGNPTWAPGVGGNPSGRAHRDKVAARSLAFTLREVVSDEELARVLTCIMRGEEPFPKETPGLGSTPPDWGVRMAAIKMLLERRNGMPMQEIHVKAELEALVATTSVPLVDAINLDALPRAALDALEEGLAGALEAGAIDAEAVEK
jgi:hypothetical protein